jgi:hypothetical protein
MRRRTNNWVILISVIFLLSNVLAAVTTPEHDANKPGSQAGWDSGFALGKTGRKLPTKLEQLAIAKRAAKRKQILVSERSEWIGNFLESFLFGFVASSEE